MVNKHTMPIMPVQGCSTEMQALASLQANIPPVKRHVVNKNPSKREFLHWTYLWQRVENPARYRQ